MMTALCLLPNDCYALPVTYELPIPIENTRDVQRRSYFAARKFVRQAAVVSINLSEGLRLIKGHGKANTRGMNAASGHIRLGDKSYHIETGQFVSAQGYEILLRSQSALILHCLVADLGALVTRDALIAKVWPDIAVTDDSLTQCILDIRRAIGDHKRQILKTVPKRGYILRGAHVESSASKPKSRFSEAKAAFQTAETHDALGSNNTRAFLIPGGETHPLIVPKLDSRDVLPTLAILPFKSQSAETQDALISFIGHEIANAVSQSEDANVISQLSTAAMNGHVGTLSEIGQILNADFVLSGSMIRNGDSVILILEFAETETQHVLWSDRMELQIAPLIRETEGIEHIVTHIRRSIMLNEVRRVRSAPLQNLKLFSVLHGAVGLMHRFSLKDFKLARTYLEYVITAAPSHPAPLAWLARWHVLRTIQGWSEDPQKTAIEALALTGRALDIDPNHTLALVCEGQVLTHISQQLDDARERYDAALARNPNDVLGRASRGTLAAFQDCAQEGTRDTERALHLTPLDPHRFFFLTVAAGANLSAENYSRAVMLAKESLRLNRTHTSTLRVLAVAQEGANQHEEAQKTATELLKLQPDFRVGEWLKKAPSKDYENGRRFAQMLRAVGFSD
jgi:adenylate cyclase